jgi:hypothetical protein
MDRDDMPRKWDNIMKQINQHDSSDIHDKIPVDIGTGMTFPHSDSVYKNGKTTEIKGLAVTMTPKGDREVYGEVFSYIGSIGAVHYYAKFENPGLQCKMKGVEGSFSCFGYQGQPKESQGFTIRVSTPAKHDVYSYSSFSKNEDGKDLMRHKGEPCDQYDTEEEAKEALLSEFSRIFDKGWVLKIGGLASRLK